ncbi:hypothetical protein A5886_000903 [Enterococcus sp. 8G7_MSG3316]|uniref:Mga helix-turn-helix domain-containing protein n=1 Tax=Candidatus Enterococcus testudinis TaxID=1834191 RepID=A0A242A457_9ENTE|nr:helix-turn-helix domain-containing protein [Enterococcus sp. 8G7_MSG3316]OTN75827.1 hypothetical protein A5886_000903 [Enterococcus sp. 8G7_MSG3316]
MHTRVKKDLLLLLNNHHDFVPTQLLVAQIGYANQYVVKKALNELFEEIRDTFDPNELSLKINKHRGVHLYSRDGNLYDALNMIISKDMGYLILITMLHKRNVPTSELCDSLFISESSLRRRIKEINQQMSFYDLRITFSKTIRLQGPEHQIRILAFSLIFYIHRSLAGLPFSVEMEKYHTLAQQVSQQLHLQTNSHQQTILSMLLFVSDPAICAGVHVVLPVQQQLYYQDLMIPDKPTFLEHWQLDDWSFLFVAVLSADWVGFDLDLDLPKTINGVNTSASQDWLHSFETVFGDIETDRNRGIAQINRQLLANLFFRLDDALFDLFHFYDSQNIQQLYPAYTKTFDGAWTSFVAQHPEFDTRYARQTNLFLCVYLFPIQKVLPEIRVYNHSHLTVTTNHYVEERIKGRFFDRCKIRFTQRIEEADLIIGTHKINASTNHQQRIVMIDTALSACDLSRIEQAIEGLIYAKVE